jgi:hypothetical protein
MTLAATISGAPLIIPKSPGRLKVREAARLLQEALDALHEEDRARAEARARRDQENERRARAHVAKGRGAALDPAH